MQNIPNNQKLEQSVDGTVLRVHSIWPTIQGEGPFAGVRAVFIRLAGCNLQCPMCDTDYTSSSTSYQLDRDEPVKDGVQGIGDLLQEISSACPIRNQHALATKQLVVITGGEPFRQFALVPLVAELVLAGYLVQIETNGTLYLPVDSRAVVVCSPKTPRIDPLLAARANAFKYVASAEDIDPLDGLPSGTLGKFSRTARPPADMTCPIYLQPLDEGDPTKNVENLRACVDSVMRHGYRLCLQLHKIAQVQ